MSTGWDSGMLKKLKSLVGKGLSTSEMGKKLGMSKNAVVGKLNRLGWNIKATEAEGKKSVKKSGKSEPAKKTVSKKAVAKPVTKVAKKEKVVAKKVETKPAKKTVVAKNAKSEKVSATKKPETKASKKTTVVEKEEKPVIKTASKKTERDLALHELLIQHALQMANLKPNQCRWPIGDPDSDTFHFCGETVFSGKPYCYEHCRQAYQFAPVKKK